MITEIKGCVSTLFSFLEETLRKHKCEDCGNDCGTHSLEDGACEAGEPCAECVVIYGGEKGMGIYGGEKDMGIVKKEPILCEQHNKYTSVKTLKDSGERTEFGTGAVRDMHKGKGRMDLLPPLALLRLGRHFESGAEKYGDRNWELGVPCHSFYDSAMRHMLKYMAGDTDEDHLIAAVWNLLCLADTEERLPEMMDIPSRLPKENKVTLYADGKTVEIELDQRDLDLLNHDKA